MRIGSDVAQAGPTTPARVLARTVPPNQDVDDAEENTQPVDRADAHARHGWVGCGGWG